MISNRGLDEAVITGVGVVNSVATDFNAFCQAALNGTSGLGPAVNFNADGLRNQNFCQARDFDHSAYGRALGEPQMDRSSAMVLKAWTEARDQAGLDPKDIAPERGAVAFGTTLGGTINGMDFYAKRQSTERHHVAQLRDYNLHAPGYRICIETGFLGANYVYSTACTSSNLAFATARDLISCDKADVVICGGFDTLSLVTCAGFSVMRNVSPDLCRPFDKSRNGLVLGEGAAVFVVESARHAAARGAAVLGKIAGSAITSDAYHMTAPDVSADGPFRCIRDAAADAGLSLSDIDLIAAHGTGTVHNDKVESRAVSKALGDSSADVPAFSIKSMVGHTLGAAGAMNAAAILATKRTSSVPATLNFEEAEDANTLAVAAQPRRHSPTLALSNALGFGGANCSVLFEVPA